MLLLLTFVIPVASFGTVACCAGALEPPPSGEMTASAPPCHGEGPMDCCDRALEDPSARRCCEGGDTFDRSSQTAPLLSLQASTPLFESPETLLDARPFEVSARDPVPRIEALYTLHSSLLI